MSKLTAKKRKTTWRILAIVSLTTIAVVAIVFMALQYLLPGNLTDRSSLETTSPNTSTSKVVPQLQTETVVAGLDHPWDLLFLPDQQLLFSERKGTISVLRDQKVVQLIKITDVYNRGEGGLMGLGLDPKFAENRFIYACFNSAKDSADLSKGPTDIRVARWKINDAVTGLQDRKDIITGIPSNATGRHSGCRMEFGPDRYLWVGTGDGAMASNSQNPKSLGGKILRVDREGAAAPGNLGGYFDPRIYSYGHRNTQGLAFASEPLGNTIGFSVEHGSTIDDEVNRLERGNFGWDPDANYSELNVPMTDKQKFPNALEASWRSGSPTQAPSGTTFVQGDAWKAWDGALAIAMLKGKHLKILSFDASGKLTKEERALTDKGRLRAVRQAPDGSLYVTTDNGNNDQIVRLAPRQ